MLPSKSVNKKERLSSSLLAWFNKAKKNYYPPKFLKHFIRKRTSSNHVWTALFNSESFGTCLFKAQEKHSQGQQSFKFSFTDVNSDLLEVCSSLVQASGCNTRLVNPQSNLHSFSFSEFRPPAPNVSFMQGTLN